jgi:futalosine hydrolase
MLERLLLITATKLEAYPLHQVTTWERLEFPLGELYKGTIPQTSFTVHLAHLGIGKVNTAAGLALAIERLKPTAVIQFGIGGAYINSFLSISMVMAARQDIHIDSGVRTAEGWQDMEQVGFALLEKNTQHYYNVLPTSTTLTQVFIDALGIPTGIFATSETITGTFDESVAFQARFDASIESMEGAAAAQVCLALDVPFAEIRSVSNIVGERDKKNWNIPKAVQRVNEVIVEMLQAMDKH